MGLHFTIPSQLAHLKVDERGYPIPYFVPIIDGKPNFKFVDEQKQRICFEKKLCGVCGKKLFEYAYFISGPLGLQNRISSDPPMHKECAEFALRACPNLYYQPAQRKLARDPVKDWYLIEDKPEICCLVKAKRNFNKVIEPVNRRVLARYEPVTCYVYEYADGVLKFSYEQKPQK